MVKRIEGSYTSIDDMMQAVRRLLNEGYYLSGDITVVTNRKNHENFENLTSVQVDKVDTVEDKTVWDRFKGMFAKPSEEAALEQYGIEMHEAVKFEEDLMNGKYVVIVNDTNLNDTTNRRVTSVDEAEEDPLLNGSVDRGPIYGVVKEETNARPLDGIVDDEPNKKISR